MQIDYLNDDQFDVMHSLWHLILFSEIKIYQDVTLYFTLIINSKQNLKFIRNCKAHLRTENYFTSV